MHARYHTTSKLSRASGPRRAVVRGLVDSLILYERITTTEAKAKAVVPQFERLVTRAKKGRLSDMRYILAVCSSPIAAQKLMYELADGFRDRAGGYTRIVKSGNRRGDNAAMATVELVLPTGFGTKKADQTSDTKKADDKAVTTKATPKKPAAQAAKQAAKKESK